MKLSYEWRKSSASPDMQNCTEVRLFSVQPGTKLVEVRNSKHPHAGSVMFSFDEWQAFLTGVKANEFEI